jgi:hypothetical protein
MKFALLLILVPLCLLSALTAPKPLFAIFFLFAAVFYATLLPREWSRRLKNRPQIVPNEARE